MAAIAAESLLFVWLRNARSIWTHSETEILLVYPRTTYSSAANRRGEGSYDSATQLCVNVCAFRKIAWKPFDTGDASVEESAITATGYHAQALKDRQSQIVLGGWRLAQALNTALQSRPDSCCKLPG